MPTASWGRSCGKKAKGRDDTGEKGRRGVSRRPSTTVPPPQKPARAPLAWAKRFGRAEQQLPKPGEEGAAAPPEKAALQPSHERCQRSSAEIPDHPRAPLELKQIRHATCQPTFALLGTEAACGVGPGVVGGDQGRLLVALGVGDLPVDLVGQVPQQAHAVLHQLGRKTGSFTQSSTCPVHGHDPELAKLGPEGRAAPFQLHAPAQEGHSQALLQVVHTLLCQKALSHALVQGKAQQKFN